MIAPGNEQHIRTALRAVSLAEQLAAATATGREIAGPARPIGLGVQSALRTLLQRVNSNTIALCEHHDLNAPALAWWTPATPGQVTCSPCHETTSAAHGGRCDCCNRRGPHPVRRALHLVEAPEPHEVAPGALVSWPPVVLDLWLCPRCRRRIDTVRR